MQNFLFFAFGLIVSAVATKYILDHKERQQQPVTSSNEEHHEVRHIHCRVI